MLEMFWRGALIGMAATVLIDAWSIVLSKIFKQPLANWAMIGRWAGHTRRFKFFHSSIREAEPVGSEYTFGWVVHYGVGAIFGIAFGYLMGLMWFAVPAIVPAWIFGIVTIGFSWFLLQPGLGVGWAASKTPRPWKTRFLNILSHSIFGVGLWGAALLLRSIAPVALQ
ncbi:DUF2938 domain-containing protein [Mesorhizobium sp. M1380]|uniref:DUF2938 domain-containing protein n=1 Tax=Mesorhizobium sp. M1380 TaxID=2957093 RepID=UPI0033359884